MFAFKGTIPSSKSVLNRLLILKSFEPRLGILGDSQAEDVQKMRSALAQVMRGEEADCGAAGTTFRFLALRCARIPGSHCLKGSPRLLARPQDEIRKLLSQFGCETRFSEDRALISSPNGWQVPHSGVLIDRSISSQFASAVLLSAWELPENLLIRFANKGVSRGYMRMSLVLAKRAGMALEEHGDGSLTVRSGSRIRPEFFEAEIDMSSAFSVAALAAATGGQSSFLNWPRESLQPDAIFPDILRDMGCQARIGSGQAEIVGRSSGLRPLNRDLQDTPDLFPVLAVLCALADGESTLSGAPQLVHKESDRIANTAELLELMGARYERVPGGLRIVGTSNKSSGGVFDPKDDHRLAMAAAVARAAGHRFEIANRRVVEKSFPEFWQIAEGRRQ